MFGPGISVDIYGQKFTSRQSTSRVLKRNFLGIKGDFIDYAVECSTKPDARRKQETGWRAGIPLQFGIGCLDGLQMGGLVLRLASAHCGRAAYELPWRKPRDLSLSSTPRRNDAAADDDDESEKGGTASIQGAVQALGATANALAVLMCLQVHSPPVLFQVGVQALAVVRIAGWVALSWARRRRTMRRRRRRVMPKEEMMMMTMMMMAAPPVADSRSPQQRQQQHNHHYAAAAAAAVAAAPHLLSKFLLPVLQPLLLQFASAGLLLTAGNSVLRLFFPRLHHLAKAMSAAAEVNRGYALVRARAKSLVGPNRLQETEEMWRRQHRWAAQRLCKFLGDLEDPPKLGWLLNIVESTTVECCCQVSTSAVPAAFQLLLENKQQQRRHGNNNNNNITTLVSDPTVRELHLAISMPGVVSAALLPPPWKWFRRRQLSQAQTQPESSCQETIRTSASVAAVAEWTTQPIVVRDQLDNDVVVVVGGRRHSTYMGRSEEEEEASLGAVVARGEDDDEEGASACCSGVEEEYSSSDDDCSSEWSGADEDNDELESGDDVAVALAARPEVVSRSGSCWQLGQSYGGGDIIVGVGPPQQQRGGYGYLARKVEVVSDWFSLFLRAVWLAVVFGPLLVMGPLLWLLSLSSLLEGSWAHLLQMGVWWMLRWCLERGGAAFIKWGQWSATREDLFSADLCEVLGRLHDRAPTHSFAQTRKAICAHLGKPIEDLFEDFDPQPCASGSIAQVHRAKLRREDGALVNVAVKVRHPSVALRIFQDFQIMSAVADVVQRLPALRWLNLRQSIDQFSHTMTAQADLRVEARNLLRFSRNFTGLGSSSSSNRVVFPTLIPDLVSEGVLVETFERGAALHVFLKDKYSSMNTQIAAIGVDTYLKMMLTDNFVHTDLHPGNIMARMVEEEEEEEQGGRGATTITTRTTSGDTSTAAPPHPDPRPSASRLELVLLDFGLAEELPPHVRFNFISFIIHIGTGDGHKAAQHLLKFSEPDPQRCASPELLAADMQRLFCRECNSAERAIDLNAVLKQVLRLCHKHGVTINSSYASLVVAVCVLVGFARSLDPRLCIMDAAVPCLFLYNLTGRIVGRIYD